MKKNNFFSIWTLLLGCVFFWAVLRLPHNQLGTNLDDSWAAVLQHAHVHGWQFGKDISFTYGPLGYLFVPSYLSPTLLPQMIVAALLLAGATAFLYMLWLSTIEDNREKVGYGLALIYLAAAALTDTNMILLLLLMLVPTQLLVTVQNTQRGTPSRTANRVLTLLSRYVVAGLAASLLLLKGTLVLPVSVVLGVQWLMWCLEGKWRAAATNVAVFLITTVALWVGWGQSIQWLPQYFGQIVEIAQGYTVAMSLQESLPMRAWGLLAGLGVAGLWLGLVGSNLWRLPRKWTHWKQALRIVLLASAEVVLVFVAWKHGFVRADGHVEIFVTAIPLFGIIWLARLGRHIVIHHKLAILTIVGLVYLVGLRIMPGGNPQVSVTTISNRLAENMTTLTNVQPLLAQPMSSEPAVLSSTISGYVKSKPLDVFAVNQAAFIKEGYQYQPRPVFQSYSAYTPRLAEANYQHLRNQEVGTLLYAQVFAIDDRYPLQDDSLAWWEMITNYTLIAQDTGAVVLEKVLPSRSPQFEPWLSKELAFDQTLAVGELPEHAWLKIKFTPTTLGKMLEIFYKPAMIKMHVEFNDGSTHEYRLVPSTTEQGFLLQPAVVTTTRLSQHLQAESTPEITQIRFYQEGITSYQNKIMVNIEAIK